MIRFGCCALIVLAACSSVPAAMPDAIVVGAGGKFDDGSVASFHLCRVLQGEGEGFFRNDTLECQVEEGALVVPIVEVWSGERFVATLRLEDGSATQTFAADLYPLEVRAFTSLVDVAGLEGYELRTTIEIADDGTWTELRGPALPMKLWTVTLESAAGLAQVAFDATELNLVGGTLRRASNDATHVTVQVLDLLVRPTEPVTLKLAVGSVLTGAAGLVGDPRPFTMQSGGTYVVSAEGLTTPEPSATGAVIVSCTTDATTICRVTNADLVESVSVDGMTLPLSGEGVLVEGSEPMEAVVQVSGDIALVDAERLGAYTRTIERTDDVELPFDILDVSTFVNADVARVAFATDASYALLFRGSWGGAFQQSGRREVLFDGGRTYVAVSPEATSVTGTLTITSELGMVLDEPSMTLESGSYVVSSNAMVASTNLESGIELARCWLVDGQLHCSRSGPEVIDTVELLMDLEAFDRTLTRSIDREDDQAITTLTQLYPLTLTLVGTKGDEDVRASIRLVTGEEIGEALVLITP